MNADENYMRRCLELAQKGTGRTAPNPLVGAVIVHEGKIVSEGFHSVFGGPHAEVVAIDNARAAGKAGLLPFATLYVNLEPCAHQGKTPPCADLIVREGVARVVTAMRDPNPKVSGRGIDKLRNADIEVVEGVLNTEALELNRRFSVYHSLHRPYIALKWARSADGIMDIHRGDTSHRGVFWISGPETKKRVHKLRGEEAAIMVGAATVANDNPRLDVRNFAGTLPLRIVVGGNTPLPADSHLFADGNPTLVFWQGGASAPEGEAVELIRVSTGEDMLDTVLATLYDRGVMSILVEGGGYTLEKFLDRRLWDEAYVIRSDNHLGTGRVAPHIEQSPEELSTYGRDTWYRFRNR